MERCAQTGRLAPCRYFFNGLLTSETGSGLTVHSPTWLVR
jgi:hypothetical protein